MLAWARSVLRVARSMMLGGGGGGSWPGGSSRSSRRPLKVTPVLVPARERVPEQPGYGGHPVTGLLLEVIDQQAADQGGAVGEIPAPYVIGGAGAPAHQLGQGQESESPGRAALRRVEAAGRGRAPLAGAGGLV